MALTTEQMMQQMAFKIRQLSDEMAKLQNDKLSPDDITAILARTPGRRVWFTMVGTQTFTTSQANAQGAAITMTVSQDGPFIMTAYPLVMWNPTTPTTATNYGRWRPVMSFPLPTQQLTTDFIDISYKMSDDGSQRNFQNEASVSGLISRPDCILPLPVWTYFRPNSVISFTPTYNAINFNSSGTATTGGTLAVNLIGFKVVNL